MTEIIVIVIGYLILALILFIAGYLAGWRDAIKAEKKIDTASTVEPKKGRWIRGWRYRNIYRCTLCGVWQFNDSHFCPNCGADMREASE